MSSPSRGVLPALPTRKCPRQPFRTGEHTPVCLFQSLVVYQMVKDAQSEDEIVFLGLESFHDLLQGAVLKRCVKAGVLACQHVAHVDIQV